MHKLKQILYLISSEERKSAFILLIMIIIMAFIDTLGIASILPFMTVVTNPDIIDSNLLLSKFYQISTRFGVEDKTQFILFLGGLVLFLLLLSLTFKSLTTYLQVRFIKMREYSISSRIIGKYLRQPYSWFLNRNSAELGKTVLSEVAVIIANGVTPVMYLISAGLISTTIILLLIVVDIKIALIVALLIGGSYGLIYFIFRKYIHKIGKQRFKNNELRFLAVNSAFSSPKELKIGGLEKIYVDRYSEYAKNYAKNQSSIIILSQLPKFFLEAIAFSSILLLIIYLIIQNNNLNDVIPIISLYVFAGYRLLPSMQQIYISFNQLNYVGPALNSLYNDLKSLKTIDIENNKEDVIFKKNIKLKDIYYNYPDRSKTTLKKINMNISAQTIVGIVGKTGSGKTTIIDIILGLLETQSGTLEVDGKIITKNNFRNWQRLIGYVPQQVYLSDDTVAANIAFGKKNANQDAIIKAAKIANLHNFIENELPHNYLTNIGERGVKLSGGQKQRLGIARALYHNPQILILDEATSALDNTTESLVMEAIENLGKSKTIIIIAHRLSTLKKCDKIFLLDKGEIKKEGTFEQIITADFKLR